MDKLCRQNKVPRIFIHILTAVYGLACLWLYYRQSVADLSGSGPLPYQSDLPLHISMVVQDGWYYSFTAYAYKALYVLFGGGTFGIALLLAAASTATVYATEGLVCFLGDKRKKTWGTLLLALSLNLVMPVYVSSVGGLRYVSYQSANIWHNSTYICMRLAALVTLICYFRLEKRYREGLTWKEWTVFALLNIICTGIKPSFLLAFSPVMGIALLVDLIRRVPLRRILAFGSALLPSGLVILWQNSVLFGESTGNGISFRPWYTFSLHAAVPKAAVVCSVLFCGLTILATWKRAVREKTYGFVIGMTALGFLEALCLAESGTRSVDGNFLWGYSFCLSVLFTICAVKWLEMGGEKWKRLVKAALGLVYAWHLYCGIYFFVRLVGGASFWM